MTLPHRAINHRWSELHKLQNFATIKHKHIILPPWRFGCWPRLMPTMKPGTQYTGATTEAEDGFWAELYFVSGWDGWRWRWRGFPGFCSPLIIQFINVWKVEPGLHFGNGAFCLPAAGCRGRALASTGHTPTLKLNEPRTFIECWGWWLVVTGQSTLHSAPQFTHHLPPPPLPPPCRLTGCNYRSSPHKFQSIVLNPFNNQGKFTNLRPAAGQLAIIFVGT